MVEMGFDWRQAMKNDRKFSAIVKAANEAGRKAVEGFTPNPMIVGQPTTLFGNDIDFSKPTHFVADGVCGFAWVRFKGNTSFGKWAKAKGIARESYPTGLQISIHDYNQSMQKKEVHARAFAEVLCANHIEAWSESRLD